MLALRMLDILSLVLFQKCMFESLLSILFSSDHSKVFEESLLEIFTLNLLEIKISLQAMIQLLLV